MRTVVVKGACRSVLAASTMDRTDPPPPRRNDAAASGERASPAQPGGTATLSPAVEPSAEQQAFLLQALLESLPDQVYFKDRNSRFLAASRHTALKVGAPDARGLLGKTDSDFYTGEHADQAFRDEQEIIRSGVPMVNVEEKETLPNGVIRWVSTTKMPLIDRSGTIIGTFGLSRDITERKRMEDQLVRRTFYDPLTQLPNRALLLSRLQHLCGEGRKIETADTPLRFALIAINVDHFTGINESLGHDAGDEVLLQTTRRLKACLGTGDTLARLGGDDFVVLMEDVPGIHQVEQMGERVIAAFALPYLLGKREIFVTAGVGLAVHHGDYDHADQVLRDAHIALHRAKAHGPGRRELFDAQMRREAVDRLDIEMGLRRAVERQQIVVLYQPILDARTGRVEAFEALARWRHPERGLLSPDQFIPLAEQTGLIEGLGGDVLRQACQQLAVWQAKFPAARNLRMGVNLSARQLRSATLVDEVERAIAESGIGRDVLTIELTESGVMADAELGCAVLTGLRDLGARIHIDDFGTGYSSLGYLHTLPVDALKIDRSFIKRLGQSDGASEIVRAIVAVAHALRLGVVAEGVETREQLAAVRALGCTAIQGYLYSPPVSAEDAERFLTGLPMNPV